METQIIGIDCATDPKKVGMAFDLLSGRALPIDPNQLIRGDTDRFIKKTLGKPPWM